MSTTHPPPTPQEPKAWFFDQALRLSNAMFPRSLRSFMKLLLFQISPDVPESLTSAWRDESLNAVFTIAASLTFIMCFVVVFVWSAMVGTLIGTDPSRLHFLKDWVNLLNYGLLCPLHIDFGAVLIATTIRGSAELKQMTPPDRREQRSVGSYGSMFLLMLVILMAAFFANARFMTENMNSSIYLRNYWFIDHLRPDGSRVIGAFEFYYGLLNFCLLLFSLLVAAAYVSEFRLLVQIAESLDRLKTKHSMTTEVLRKKLTTFMQVYLAGKLAVAFYMANALETTTLIVTLAGGRHDDEVRKTFLLTESQRWHICSHPIFHKESNDRLQGANSHERANLPCGIDRRFQHRGIAGFVEPNR
jgi:hypothetical protein